LVSDLIERLLENLNEETLRNLSASKSIKHRGESGRAREQVIANVFRKLLPRTFEVSTGFVIDATGATSRQIDIIIARNDYHPIFEVNGIKHFMIESVVAVLQSKARITSTQLLNEALENIKSVKILDRTNRGKNYTVSGTDRGPLVNLKNYRHRIFGAIVTEESLSIETLKQGLLAFFQTNPRDYRPNQYVDVRNFSLHYVNTDKDPRGHMVPAVAQHLAITDNTSPTFVPPIIELATELISFIRVTPLIDYNPLDYFLARTTARPIANLDKIPPISPRSPFEPEAEKKTSGSN
jgi:hypothetical protein